MQDNLNLTIDQTPQVETATNITNGKEFCEVSPKVRPGRLQKLIRKNYFKVILTIILMVLIFTTAFVIAYQVGKVEKETSAFQTNIIPEATIIVPRENKNLN